MKPARLPRLYCALLGLLPLLSPRPRAEAGRGAGKVGRPAGKPLLRPEYVHRSKQR